MEIRRAAADDYETLMMLYSDFTERDYSGPDKDSFQKVLASKTNFIVVAEESSRLAGFITASMRPVVRYPEPIMQVDELYVDPDFRKHGLGRQLIEAVEELAHKHGCSRVYIESGYKHRVAHKFYQKNGYPKQGYYFKKDL